MKKGIAIIGANFGDEGKGLMTSYCCNNYKNPIVIRFNGGAQAGHTVYFNNLRHVFNHFGSGTFQGVPTYLSEYFVVNPLVFLKELKELQKANIKPTVYLDKECLVSTPYDMLINQISARGGKEYTYTNWAVGFNETIERSSKEEYCLKVKDLYNKDYMKIVKAIKENYVNELLKKKRIQKIDKVYKQLLKSDSMLIKFERDVEKFKKNVILKEFKDIDNDMLIFEGAQGLMLDENCEYFPFVSHSNTGIKNVVNLLNKNNISDIDLEVIYVTRCYVTRHGHGPLPGEVNHKIYQGVVDLTNKASRYQGMLRFAPLNLDLLKSNIQNDLKNIDNSRYCIKKSLAVTCLDQVDDNKVKYIKNNKLMSVDVKDFTKELEKYLGENIKYYFSYDKVGKKIVI